MSSLKGVDLNTFFELKDEPPNEGKRANSPKPNASSPRKKINKENTDAAWLDDEFDFESPTKGLRNFETSTSIDTRRSTLSFFDDVLGIDDETCKSNKAAMNNSCSKSNVLENGAAIAMPHTKQPNCGSSSPLSIPPKDILQKTTNPQRKRTRDEDCASFSKMQKLNSLPSTSKNYDLITLESTAESTLSNDISSNKIPQGNLPTSSTSNLYEKKQLSKKTPAGTQSITNFFNRLENKNGIGSSQGLSPVRKPHENFTTGGFGQTKHNTSVMSGTKYSTEIVAGICPDLPSLSSPPFIADHLHPMNKEEEKSKNTSDISKGKKNTEEKVVSNADGTSFLDDPTLFQAALQAMKSEIKSNTKLSRITKCPLHRADNFKVQCNICHKCLWPIDFWSAFSNLIVQFDMLKLIRIKIPIGCAPTPHAYNQIVLKYLVRMWHSAPKLKAQNAINKISPVQNVEEEDEEDCMCAADTFLDYIPTKWKVGKSHPDSIVETASLASVQPPDIQHNTLSIPEETINSGGLSILQLESIAYASQQHEHFLPDGNRAGFLIGDGAGVGKGRTIAGIIFDNFLKGRRKSIWVSVSNDLKFDAERDLRDIGADIIPVQFLSKLKYGKISKKLEGVMFSTYSALIGHTHSSDKQKLRSRLDQIVDWCGEDFDGCIIFDECHKAKNLIPQKNRDPTKTGFAVLNLQKRLPKARLLYASATGASEPKDMAYMVRLGIWGLGTPFEKFVSFMKAVEKRGVGAMEIVALDMKLRGSYLARQLSFSGVSFHIEEVHVDDEFRKVYDDSVALWVRLLDDFRTAFIVCPIKKEGLVWRLFWSFHQRFFKYLCIAAKVEHVVRIAKDAVKDGKCVVIGLQMTGEACTLQQFEKYAGNLTEFVSTSKGVLETLVEKYFPGTAVSKDHLDTTCTRSGRKIQRDISFNESENDESIDEDDLDNYKPKGIEKTTPKDDAAELPESKKKDLNKMKTKLLNDIAELGQRLPPNSLDELILKLGGAQNVAEMTGRKGRMVQKANGKVAYESRADGDIPLEHLNISEKESFMEGKKFIAIISEAASSGISLQSDRRVANQRRRVHITLELPWSADRAIQQFGRTHRSNQHNAPEYAFVISDLAGERRFASIVAKRLESLGALTHGDRRATEARNLSTFNVDNRYGAQALKATLGAILGTAPLLVPFPVLQNATFVDKVTEALIGVAFLERIAHSVKLCKEANTVRKFLNRILGLPVTLQNALFKFFSGTHDAIIQEEKRNGKFDLGILDLGAGGQSCTILEKKEWETKHLTGKSKVILYTVDIDRGFSWEEAMQKYGTASSSPEEGFYKSTDARFGKIVAVLAIKDKSLNNLRVAQAWDALFIIYRPHLGRGASMTYRDMLRKYKKVTPNMAKNHWMKQYNFAENKCSHLWGSGTCNRTFSGMYCSSGKRKTSYNVLCGSILNVWSLIEEALAFAPTLNSRVQVVRLRTSDGQKLVGTMIPKVVVYKLKSNLDSKVEEGGFEGKDGPAIGDEDLADPLSSALSQCDSNMIYEATSRPRSKPKPKAPKQPARGRMWMKKSPTSPKQLATLIRSLSPILISDDEDYVPDERPLLSRVMENSSFNQDDAVAWASFTSLKEENVIKSEAIDNKELFKPIQIKSDIKCKLETTVKTEPLQIKTEILSNSPVKEEKYDVDIKKELANAETSDSAVGKKDVDILKNCANVGRGDADRMDGNEAQNSEVIDKCNSELNASNKVTNASVESTQTPLNIQMRAKKVPVENCTITRRSLRPRKNSLPIDGGKVGHTSKSNKVISDAADIIMKESESVVENVSNIVDTANDRSYSCDTIGNVNDCNNRDIINENGDASDRIPLTQFEFKDERIIVENDIPSSSYASQFKDDKTISKLDKECLLDDLAEVHLYMREIIYNLKLGDGTTTEFSEPLEAVQCIKTDVKSLWKHLSTEQRK